MLQELFMWTPVILEHFIVLNMLLRREKHRIQLTNHTHLKLRIVLFIGNCIFLQLKRRFVKTFISSHFNLVMHDFHRVLSTMLS